MRAVILGNSGSGKTWLSKRLGELHMITPTALDDIHWEPGGFDVRRAAPEVTVLIDAHLLQPHWIVEGVYGDLAEPFLEGADELVWLDLPWEVCSARLSARGSESKQHMGRGQTSQGLRSLLTWAEAYYTRNGACSRSRHQGLFSEFAGLKHRLCAENEVTRYMHMRSNPSGHDAA